MRFRRAVLAAALTLVVMLALVGSQAAQAQTFTTLYTFTWNGFQTDAGYEPVGQPVVDGSGNIFGTTEQGGTYGGACEDIGCGTVWEYSSSGTLSVLHSFDYYDGNFLIGGVMLDKLGNVFGTTVEGGSYGSGTVFEIKSDGTEFAMNSYAECYTHDSLVTVAANCNGGNDSCDRGYSWGYYMPVDRAIWNAPAAIPEVCYGQNSDVGGACVTGAGTEYTGHVHVAKQGYSDAPIFDDLYNCGKDMPKISWVIPDLRWSDHPYDNQDGFGSNAPFYGPSWVGDIVNAVGQACGGKYWSTEPTAVIVVWDDWGGWFDHIAPYKVLRSPNETSCPQTQNNPNGWGCGYTYGFRVPLLVVSPYTGTQGPSGIATYISGACGAAGQPSCPNNVFPYVHDFGSILRFTEYNFGMPYIDESGDNGYADQNAPDNQNGNIPLSDFFSLYPNQRTFVPITTLKDYKFFQGYYETTGAEPMGPDNDADSD